MSFLPFWQPRAVSFSKWQSHISNSLRTFLPTHLLSTAPLHHGTHTASGKARAREEIEVDPQ
jgi:hypothetical protein